MSITGMAASDAMSSGRAVKLLESQSDSPLFIDLDQTLVLRSTTEGFICSVRPSSLVAVLLFVVEKLQIWRFLPGGNRNRDWVRVVLVLVVMPWAWLNWKRKAASWTETQTNTELMAAVKNHRGPVVVVTRGFDFIVTPVAHALGFSQVVSCQVFRWRGGQQRNKFEQLAQSDHAGLVAESTVVTNSLNDQELLDACHTPILASWPGSAWEPLLENAYFPLRYVHLTKNPYKRFIRFAWLQDDLYVVLLAFSLLTTWFPLHAVGVVLASFALWITYEIGYHENDVLGSKREENPMLPNNFEQVRGAVPSYAPWVWSSAATVLAAPLLAVGSGRSLSVAPLLAIGWLAVLLFVRLVFALFNRLPKPHRVIPHLLLQVGKYAGYAVVAVLTPLGAALVIAQVLYRWVPYIGYRWGREKRFPLEPLNRTRFVAFIFLAVPSVIFSPFSVGLMAQFGLGVAVFGRRALTTQLKSGSK